METRDLILTKARFEDWEDMYRSVWSRPETARYMLWTVTDSEEEARARMERTLAWQRDHDVWTVYQKTGRQAIGWAGGAVAWDLAGNQHRLGAGLCGPGLWAAASGAADGDRPGTGRNGVPLFRLVGKYGFQSADYFLRVYIGGGGALY